MSQFILASNSPRRKELLSLLGLDFTIQVSPIDERAVEAALPQHLRTPSQLVAQMAQAKGLAVANHAQAGQIVIAADTIVAYDNQILHKPKDEADAQAMLSKLSGQTHTVYTGMSVIYLTENTENTENPIVHTSVTATDVTFRTLTQQEIQDYIATGEPMDKAGAYGIQGKGCILVDRIQGDYLNVVGLSLTALYEELRANGVEITKFW